MSSKGSNFWGELARVVGNGLVEKARDSYREMIESERPPPDDPPPPPVSLSSWASLNDVAVDLPEDYIRTAATRDLGRTLDYRVNPCIDFGKFIERVPSFVLRPRDQTQLASCLRFLSRERVPFKTRASAHSSGGQVLIDGPGAVVDLAELDRIAQDRPEAQEIEVEGGIWWSEVASYLFDQGRRPPVLTDNWDTSVAGTLSVGGFGHSSHLHGLQIGHVTALTIITPNGARHRVSPGDPLFDYSLGGRGQLGVIASATLSTVRSSWTLMARVLRWAAVDRFIEAAIRIAEEARFDLVDAKVFWDKEASVRTVVGNFQQRWGLDEGLSYDLGCTAHPPAQRDFYEVGRLHPEERYWNKNWPCLDIVLPLPDGVETFHEIHGQIRRGLLKRYLRLGSTLRVVKAPPSELKRLPLAPVVGSGYDLLVSIRPVVSGYAAHSVLPELLALRELVLARGGKIYLISVEPEDPSQLQLERQFGTALDTFKTLKERYDPNGLLNPGLLA